MTASNSNVITLRAPRPIGAIRADLVVHLRAVDVLTAELEVAAGCEASSPVGREEPTLSLKQAAHKVGWSQATLRRHLVRENTRNPIDPLGFQPGGLPGSPWRIRKERLQRYVRNFGHR